jgi:hypothetical protein
MAAFLERGLGRVGLNSSSTSIPANSYQILTGVFIDTGAVASGTGFVLLNGNAELSATVPSQCPCEVRLILIDLDDGDLIPLATTRLDIGSVPNAAGVAYVAGSVQAVIPVAGGSTRRFGLRAGLSDTATSVVGSGTLSALYVPFGPDGDDTQPHCTTQEGEPNGTIAQAKSLIAQPMFGCIEPAGDTDFFYVAVGPSGQLRATTTGLAGPGTCDTDTYVRIRTGAGAIISEDDNNGAGACSDTITVPLSAGTYIVQVFGASGSIVGSYRLTTTVSFPP